MSSDFHQNALVARKHFMQLEGLLKQKQLNEARVEILGIHPAQFGLNIFKKSLQGFAESLGTFKTLDAGARCQPF